MINCIMTWALCGIFPPGSITVCSVDINQSYAPCTLPISLPRVSIPQENLSAHGTVRNILAGNSVEAFGGLGYELGSSWSRGQSWALYSYVLSYIHTQKQEYLDAAKQVAHYFIANLAEYPVSLCDFRAPEIPIIYDSTAGACATYELIETAKKRKNTKIILDVVKGNVPAEKLYRKIGFTCTGEKYERIERIGNVCFSVYEYIIR